MKTNHEQCSCRHRLCGTLMAMLLSQRNRVMAMDIPPKKVEKIKRRIFPMQDTELEEYLAIRS